MKNKYPKFLLLALLIIIIVPQVAFAAWWNPFSWGVWNSIFHFQRTIQNPPGQQNKNPVVGGDKDAHDCIGSAGYTWCEAKQKCLRVWEEKCETDQTAGWKKYSNSEYNFELRYPTTAVITENNENVSWFGGANQVSVRTVATISTPTAGQREAFVIVYVGNGNNSANNCNKINLNAQASQITETKNLNGTVFYVGGYSDAAMGGARDNVTQYSVLKNNLCYLIQANATWRDVTFVHGATDGKQPTKQELNAQSQKIKNEQSFVESIISTFKFTK